MSRSRRSHRLRLESLERRDLFAGQLDLAFGDGDGMAVFDPQLAEGAETSLGGMQLDGDRIVLAGTLPGKTVTTGSGNKATTVIDASDFALVRFLADGTHDPSFGAGGKAMATFTQGDFELANDVAVASGKYIVVGSTNTAHSGVSLKNDDFAIARFNASGTLDTSFSGDGKATFQFGAAADGESAFAVVVQPDGKIVVGGLYVPSGSDQRFALTRFHANGTVDTSFGNRGRVITNVNLSATPGTAASSEALTELALQTINGITYIVAAGTAYTSSPAFANDVVLVRYKLNGQLDTAFGQAGIVRTDVRGLRGSASVGSLVALGDGRLVIAGSVRGSEASPTTATESDPLLLRYLPNGTLDASFGTGGIVDLPLPDGQGLGNLVVDAAGRLVATGTWSHKNELGETDYRHTLIARFTTDGSPDTSWGENGFVIHDLNPTASNVNEQAQVTIAIASDGNYVLAGSLQDDNVTIQTQTQWFAAKVIAYDNEELLALLAMDQSEQARKRR